MVQQRAVAWQKRARYFQRDGVPELTLFSHLINLEIFKLLNLVLELDNESDLGGGAKVPHDQEANHLQKAVPCENLFVLPLVQQLFKLDRRDLHDVADVQILNPLRLVQEAEDVAQVDV